MATDYTNFFSSLFVLSLLHRSVFSCALYLLGSWDIGSQCNEKLINQLKLFQLFRLVEVPEVRPKLFKVSSFWETEESPTLFRCIYN